MAGDHCCSTLLSLTDAFKYAMLTNEVKQVQLHT